MEKAFINKNIKKIKKLASEYKVGNELRFTNNNENLDFLIQIKDLNYKPSKLDYINYSTIYKVIKSKDKLIIVRKVFKQTLYEWLLTDPEENEVKLIYEQIETMNSILDKKDISDKLEDLWIECINPKCPLIINGNKIKHTGNIIAFIETSNDFKLDELNNEIRKKNILSLYSLEELDEIYDMKLDDIVLYKYNDLIKNRVENNTIGRILS